MKKTPLIAFLGLMISCLLGTSAMGQQSNTSRFVYSAKLTFQAYGLPTKNTGASFRNAGVATGLDYAYNKKHSIFQTFTLGYQTHNQHETGYYLNTQLVYRPTLFGFFEPSVGLGIGHLISVSNPANPFYEIENGTWNKSTSQTASHWQAPISLGLGFRAKTQGTAITPFIGYEAVPIINYNSAFVVMPYSLVNVGTRFKF